MSFEEVSLFFSFIVAISTVVYAILTWKLVSETRKMREVQTEPHLSIYLIPNERVSYFKDLVIKNIGLGPAYTISFSINPDFVNFRGGKLSEVGFMKKGIKYLAPNQKYQLFLTNMQENFKEKSANPFSISVTYYNLNKKLYTDIFQIDFSEWENVLTVDTKGLSDISKNLEDIKSSIDAINQEIREK
jgi:hypothetical protein